MAIGHDSVSRAPADGVQGPDEQNGFMAGPEIGFNIEPI
jgi:hypothetical protein